MKRLLVALALAALVVIPLRAAGSLDTTYKYRQDGARITVTYICDDGTIVPGPHPKAIVNYSGNSGWTTSISAHGVEKLDVAMQSYLGLSLTAKAKAFLYSLLPQITCPPLA